MKTAKSCFLIIFMSLLTATLYATRPDHTPDLTKLPRTITTGPQGAFHVQGIAVDLEKGYMYFSFTTKLIKTDLNGKLIGSVGGMLGHLGCLTLNPKDKRVYGSLEYKNDKIGKGIRNKLQPNGGNLENKEENATGFYIAIFDVDKITRPDMDAEKDKVMTTVFIKEAYDDYFAKVDNGGKTVKHRFCCSGIDGTTIAPALGKKGKSDHIYIAYGVYGDKSRTDNDYQVILSYNLKKWKKYESQLSQGNLHRNGPSKPDHKYFVYTGNTSFGVQNLAYDKASRNFYMAVYKGKKKEFPNYPLFIADGNTPPRHETLKGVNPQQKGEVLSLLPEGKSESGIYGWDFNIGNCGLCPIGKGYFYISQDKTDKDKKHYSIVRLYKWTGDSEQPFTLVK